MLSKEYLSFSKRERTGIIILVLLIIMMAVLPKFFCGPNTLAEKLPDKQMQQLAEKKLSYYTEKKYRERDTVYVTLTDDYYHKHNYERNYTKRKGMPGSLLQSSKDAGGEKRKSQYKQSPGWVRPAPTSIDINTADTSAFIALPGIGSKLANRIISFRTKLGGFHSVEQIKEVYGLRDSVFQIIRPFLRCQVSP